MLSKLIVQEVDFNGDTLVAVRSPEDDKVYVGVSWICDGLGLTKKQKDRQVANIQSDVVLSLGAKKLPLEYEEQVRNALSIELDFLPLWLAKISITPSMKRDNPDVVKNLVDYQLKAQKVLAEVFINQTPYITPKSYKEAVQHLLTSIEENEVLKIENEKMKPKASFHDDVADIESASSIINVGKSFGIGEYKFLQFLRSVGILFIEEGCNVPKQQYQNQGYFEVKTSIEDSDSENKMTYNTKVTGKGQTYLHKVVKRYGGGEIINSLSLNKIEEYVQKKFDQIMSDKIS